MRCRFLSLFTLLLLTHADAAAAIDVCDDLISDSDALRAELAEQMSSRSPVRYHALSQTIELTTDAGGRVWSPVAVKRDSKNLVVVPVDFAGALCRLAYVTFLAIEDGDWQRLDAAAADAAQCLDEGNGKAACIGRYSHDLAEAYQAQYEQLPEGEKGTAYSIFRSALYQLVAHEYAHFFYRHSERVEAREIERIDAEFEADFFSILNGVQQGEVPSAMFYFFDPIAGIERLTTALVTEKYESADCRAANAEAITGTFGVIPILLLNAASGGSSYLQLTSPEEFRQIGSEAFADVRASYAGRSCGRLAEVVLSGARSEMQQLFDRMAADADILYSADEDLDLDRTLTLLSHLSDLVQTFRHMDGLAAKIASTIALRLAFHNDKADVVASTERLMATTEVTDDMISMDYGRLLSIRGLAIFQQREDLPRDVRIEDSLRILGRAVHYNSQLTEAWMNLAFIALMAGDCRTAAEHALRSSETANPPHDQEAAGFAGMVKQLENDPAGCRSMSTSFKPYGF